MTAGRGIVHCEMPHGTEQAHGLQLWVNLASKDKMTAPAYQELLDKDIPKTKQNGVHVKVIAGESLGIKVGVTMYYVQKENHTMYIEQTLRENPCRMVSSQKSRSIAFYFREHTYYKNTYNLVLSFFVH